MLFLDKTRLRQQVAEHGWSMADLARHAGISRQSLYNMFERNPVFNTSFAKILATLQVPYRAITQERSAVESVLADAPPVIRKVIVALSDFCRAHHAALLLFGSRVRGKSGPRADWDFAIYCHGAATDRVFRAQKRAAQERGFPYRVDVVHLNHAPDWFRAEVDQSHLVLYGRYP